MADAMSMNLINVSEFVSKRKLVKIESALIFDAGRAVNPKGLFSIETFGYFGSKERLGTYAYIDLGGIFLHPLAYSLLTSASSDIIKLFSGNSSFDIEDGSLIIKPVDEGKYKGSADLHKFWSEFVNSLEDTGTKSRKEMILFFKKYDRDTIWIDKWPVLPAGLRDLNMTEFESSGVVNYDEINDLYIKLLNNASSIYGSSASDDLFMGMQQDSLLFKVQQTLFEIHNFIMRGKISGKNKFIRKNALKKTVMYSVGDVISMAPQFQTTYNSELTNNIRTGEIGVPVTVLMDAFYPFVLHELSNRINNSVDTGFRDFLYAELVKENEEISDQDLLEKFINTCINDKNFTKKVMYTGSELEADFDYNVMDFLKNEVMFQIVGAKGQEPKKFVVATRYPINNMKSTQILAPIPYTTSDVKMKEFAGKAVEITNDPENYSTSLMTNQASLTSWGGDYDGDKIVIIGVFMEESNRDIKEKGAWFRENNLDLNLNPTSNIGIENLMGLNYLTR